MVQTRVGRYFLVVLLLVVLYLSLRVANPLLSDIVIAGILVLMFYPAYTYLLKKLKYRKNLTSMIMVILILLLIVIPTGFVINSLISQASSAYTVAKSIDLTNVTEMIPGNFIEGVQVENAVDEILLKTRNIILNEGPGIIGSIATFILDLFVIVFMMFYSFRDGKLWMSELQKRIPMRKEYITNLFDQTNKSLGAVLYGYILAAIIQGTLAGLLLFIFGIANPVFWGFIMILFAILPLIGTALVWLHAAGILLYNGQIVAGVLMIILQTLVANMDVFIRPKLVSSKSDIHPVIVLIGVLGGVSAFGFMGIIIGPVILSILTVLINFFLVELKKSNKITS